MGFAKSASVLSRIRNADSAEAIVDVLGEWVEVLGLDGVLIGFPDIEGAPVAKRGAIDKEFERGFRQAVNGSPRSAERVAQRLGRKIAWRRSPGSTRVFVGVEEGVLNLESSEARFLIEAATLQLLSAACDALRVPVGELGNKLTQRQRQILQVIARGGDLGDAAKAAGIRVSTALFHMRAAKQRLGAKNRAHAVALAIAAGDIST